MLLIETTSRESMEHDLAAYLDITIEELYQYIDYAAEKANVGWAFNTDIFSQEIASIIDDLQPLEHIDSVMCFHLSRRLNNSLDDLCSYNLKILLLGDNPTVRFLNAHNVFFKKQDNYISIYYRGLEVILENNMETDVCYLRSRLGYNCGREDYFFNGFAMRDLLMKNSYTRKLYDGPEFLVALSHYLKNEALLDDFTKQSTYFCYTLKIPMQKVIFDGFDELNNNEKESHLVSKICQRLLMYSGHKQTLFDCDNPIIRVTDDSILPANYVVNREIITLDMIE